MSAALSVLKLSVQNVFRVQHHTIEVCFEMTGLSMNSLSMNSCGESFYADSKAVFSSAMSVGFGVYGVLVSHPTLDNNLVHWALKSSDLNINEVILKSQLQFN